MVTSYDKPVKTINYYDTVSDVNVGQVVASYYDDDGSIKTITSNVNADGHFNIAVPKNKDVKFTLKSSFYEADSQTLESG